jgi:hypothetical protein
VEFAQFSKNPLRVVGYPRSGNVFLNHAISLLFFPEKGVDSVYHTVKKIQEEEHVFTPIRDPLDCLASWCLFREVLGEPQNKRSIEEDMIFYIRFHKGVLENLHKITLLDFESFTSDLLYLTKKIDESVGMKPLYSVSINQVKESMLANEKAINLPRSNNEEKNFVKELVKKEDLFKECLELYNQIKNTPKNNIQGGNFLYKTIQGISSSTS